MEPAPRRGRPDRRSCVPLINGPAFIDDQRPHRAATTASTPQLRHLPPAPDPGRQTSTSGAYRPTRATTSTAIPVAASAQRPGLHPARTRNPCSGTSPIAANVPAAPFLAEPDHLRRAAHRRRRRPLLPRHSAPRGSLAGDDRLRPAQLQPEPHGAADHDGRPTRPPASTSTSRSRRPRARPPPRRRRSARPRSPCPRASRSTPTPPTARSPAPTTKARSAPEAAAECPETRRSARCRIDSSALPGADPGRDLPRRAAARRPLPALPRRRRLRHPRQARRHRSRPDPQTGQLVVAFADLPQTPFQEFNLHFFGSERGPAGDPDAVRHLPGRRANSCPGTPCSPTRPRPASSRSTPGPTAAPCPGRRAPFDPRLQGRHRRQHRRRRTARSRSSSTATDGDQNLERRSRSRRRPASRRPSRASPTARRRRSASSRLRLLGLAELASPACPAASQIGTATAGAGAGTHPLYVAGKVYLAGPYKGAPLSLVVVIPAVSGPYDLGNVVGPGGGPRRPGRPPRSPPSPTRCRRSSTASRCASARSRSTSTGPTSPSTRPTATRSRSTATIFGDEGAQSPAPSRHFQVANCADLPFGPKLSLKLTGGVKRRGHPAIHAVLTAQPGEANTRSVSVALPQGRAARQRPHRHRLHQGRSSPPTPARRARCSARAEVDHAAARRSR